MSDIVERLRELERVERELAHDGDCPPEATANWRYAETCKSAADEIERLGRDYDTARDAHDRRVRELDAHCVEVARLRNEIERFKVSLADMVTQTQEQADEIERLRAALEAWNHAVRIDVLMEGPRYMGVSVEAGKRAWEMTRAALKEDGE